MRRDLPQVSLWSLVTMNSPLVVQCYQMCVPPEKYCTYGSHLHWIPKVLECTQKYSRVLKLLLNQPPPSWKPPRRNPPPPREEEGHHHHPSPHHRRRCSIPA